MGSITPPSPRKPLRVAIVGAGPAGLGAAIALSALPDVQVDIYEKATELREVGAGIRIGFNCWKVLGLLGAADRVRGHHKVNVFHRNGITGEVVGSTQAASLPPRQQPHRVRRTNLQSALVETVPPGIIHLRKALKHLNNLDEGVRLSFEDGSEVEADLVVGADGIRSSVRDAIFPDHTTKFTGTTIWRTLIPLSSVSHLPDVKTYTTWWYGKAGHVYTSPVDDAAEMNDDQRMLEISCRNLVDPKTDTRKRFSWGVPATNETVLSHFIDYSPQVLDALNQAPEGSWKEFSAFAGPRLQNLTGWDNKCVLLGDASHPLSGAFGSGAAFALEDGWILARAIEYTDKHARPWREAIEMFDEIRSPYYSRMYEFLDSQKESAQAASLANADPEKKFEAALKLRADGINMETKVPWIYLNDIENVWREYVENYEREKEAAASART
ncbi:hypothetical protein Q7P37_000050 [Cladosporium fusiforme]